MKEFWPNFFIVGARNAGTSSLHVYLRRHPDVFMPGMKEPHFFSRLRPYSQLCFPTSHVSDEASYLKLFAKGLGHGAIGEASTSYLWDSLAPSLIHSANPQAKIIMLLRDPVERAYSHYLFNVREGYQNLPFYEALLEDWRRPEKVWGLAHLYVEIGQYRQQVKRYLDIFGPEQVLVLLSANMRTLDGRRKMLVDVANFLELDAASVAHIDLSPTENPFAVPRWNWSRRMAGNMWVRRLARSLVPPSAGSTWLVKGLIYDRFFLRGAPRPPMDPRAREWLCAIYDDDLSALEGLLGCRLPELRSSWGRASGDCVVQAAGSQ